MRKWGGERRGKPGGEGLPSAPRRDWRTREKSCWLKREKKNE